MSLLSSQHAVVWRAPAPCVTLGALLALAALAQSCSTGPTEGRDSCEASVDADGDGASGCADSDCHRFELCRVNASNLGPPDSSVGGSGSASGSGGSTDATGGMSGGGTTGGGGSGGDEAMEDSGVEPDASECSCGSGELCLDGECASIEPPPPRYIVALQSAESPIGLPGPPPDGLCVEIACREPFAGSPVSYCPCEPEPYVRVVHIRSPELDPVETVVLTTKVQGTALSVSFDETERVEVPLQVGDELRFELWDDNVTTMDTLIYSCQPELGMLTAGPLTCTVLSGALASTRFSIHGELIVQ